MVWVAAVRYTRHTELARSGRRGPAGVGRLALSPVSRYTGISDRQELPALVFPATWDGSTESSPNLPILPIPR
jgi:hypothetical protein